MQMNKINQGLEFVMPVLIYSYENITVVPDSNYGTPEHSFEDEIKI